MRALLISIARLLAAMPILVTKFVWESGKWVARLFREERAPMPLPSAAPQDQEPETSVSATDINGRQVRMLARLILDGDTPTPDQMEGVAPRTKRWVCTLTPDMLQKLVLADNAAIAAHVRGRKSIRGVLTCEDDAIDDLQRVLDRERNVARRHLEWSSRRHPQPRAA